MKIPIIPIMILAVTLILGGTALFFLRRNKVSETDIEKEKRNRSGFC